MTASATRDAAPAAPSRAAPASTRAVLGVAALTLVLRLIPAALAFGTSDVLAWDQLARLFLSGENFYATQLHNWPVLWIYFTAAAALLHDATQVPFSFLVKLGPIAADTAIAVLLARLSPKLGLAYAVNPIAILVTGYHGQFDALMLAPAFLAWTIWTSATGAPIGIGNSAAHSIPGRAPSAPGNSATRVPTIGATAATPVARTRIMLTALSLGLAIWFKPVPLVLLPIFLLRLPNNRQRALFTALALAPATVGTLPYFLMWPQDVAANFLGYSSWFGQWGYPVVWMVVEYVRNGTIPWWLPDPDHVSLILRWLFTAGRFVLLAGLAITWWWTWRKRTPVLHSIVAVFAVFYAATVGFGVQYLLWIVPFAIAARERWLWPFTITATTYLLVAYTLGLAYRVVDPIPDNGPSGIEFIVKLASLPTWLTSAAWAISLLRR